MERGQPGNELAELLWENGPALQWTAAQAPFPPFSCSAAGTTRVQELGKHPTSTTAMAQDDHDDTVPWPHYPIIGMDEGGTEYCGVLPQYYSDIDVHVPTNRLRSTPLFSEQRMAWLEPLKESPAPPPPALPVPVRHAAEPAAALPQRLQPGVRAPATTTTTSSVRSNNGDRSQLKMSSTGHKDLDDEAGWLRRSAARSTKRGRTVEVHNMSDRRRRDRINDKMRALQELIPNCNNKIDKASMLEEAIEYLKTLELQVQMMSTMGLCVPPMQAMQLMQMSPMTHLHHHLGPMGFGMDAFDPRLAGTVQFPYPMIPGMPMFHQAAAAAPAGAHMAASTVTNNAATVQAEQTPSVSVFNLVV